MATTFQIKTKTTPHLKEKWDKPTATVENEFETVEDATCIYLLNTFNKNAKRLAR